MSEFADLFLDFAFETITARRGTVDNEGTWTPVGAAVTVPCRFEGQIRTVRNAQGQEFTSSVQAIVLGTPNFNPQEYRFTLPSRFTPNTNVQALSVGKESDESGPCYEEVFFP